MCVRIMCNTSTEYRGRLWRRRFGICCIIVGGVMGSTGTRTGQGRLTGCSLRGIIDASRGDA